MQSMQRQFGKLLRKGPGDNAKVSVLLNDYEDADKVLAQVTLFTHPIKLRRHPFANRLRPSSSTIRGCGETLGLPLSTRSTKS